MESDKKPRLPTAEEKAQLIQYLAEDLAHGPADEEARKEAEGYVELACIAVFDDYITGCPGYAGKVMVVVYDGGPYQTETYTWRQTINEGEEHIPLGQINWHDGKHEPRLVRDVSIQS